MNPVIVVELLGVKNLALALGYITMFRGVGVLAGPPIAGAIYDATQSYDIPFYLTGGFMISSCLLLTIAAICHQDIHSYILQLSPFGEKLKLWIEFQCFL